MGFPVSPKLEPVELAPEHDGDGDLVMLDAESDVPRRGLLSNSLLTVTKEDEFGVIRYCFSRISDGEGPQVRSRDAGSIHGIHEGK